MSAPCEIPPNKKLSINRLTDMFISVVSYHATSKTAMEEVSGSKQAQYCLSMSRQGQ